jgi:hypothetical protein
VFAINCCVKCCALHPGGSSCVCNKVLCHDLAEKDAKVDSGNPATLRCMLGKPSANRLLVRMGLVPVFWPLHPQGPPRPLCWLMTSCFNIACVRDFVQCMELCRSVALSVYGIVSQSRFVSVWNCVSLFITCSSSADSFPSTPRHKKSGYIYTHTHTHTHRHRHR